MKWIKCEWKNFEEFYKDMKDWYAIDLTIDREDSTWNYCKSNCRWKTPKEQARNKENNRLYKWKCLAEWCEELWLNYKTIYSRINLYWWSYKDALEFNN